MYSVKVSIMWADEEGMEHELNDIIERTDIESAVNDGIASLGSFQRHIEKEQGRQDEKITD